jgi:hypothetical protein
LNVRLLHPPVLAGEIDYATSPRSVFNGCLPVASPA